MTLSTSGIGVHGHPLATTGNTIGVLGLSESPDGAGVQAINSSLPDGVAVQVFGRSQFQTIIDSVVPAGQDSATVTDSRVTSNGAVMVCSAGPESCAFQGVHR